MRENATLLWLWSFHSRSVFLLSELNASLYLAHFGIPDENLMLVNQDSVSRPQEQVEKQTTFRKERRHCKYNTYG